MRRTAAVVKASIMMNVYEQAIHLTNASRQQCTIGQTTNLMSIDADKIALASQFVHFLWHAPCSCFAIFIILIFEIGFVASFFGISFLFCFMPLSHFMAQKIGQLRRFMVNLTDERVKLTNEILQSIRTIKM